MTTPRKKAHRNMAHHTIDHVEELERERTAILAILANSRRPSRAASANHGTVEHVNHHLDDYSMFAKPDGASWGVCGLKLSTDILTFSSREEATARGTALARAGRVSLWYEPTSHRRDSILVASFRDDVGR